MVISSFARVLFFILLTALSSSCGAGECSRDFDGELLVSDWSGDPPKSALLEQYRAKSNFENPENIYSEEFFVSIDVNECGRRYLRVRFVGHERLPIDRDYRLVLDRKIEFRITDIVPTNKRAWGCPLDSAKVNGREVVIGHVVSFSRESGVSVQP